MLRWSVRALPPEGGVCGVPVPTSRPAAISSGCWWGARRSVRLDLPAQRRCRGAPAGRDRIEFKNLERQERLSSSAHRPSGAPRSATCATSSRISSTTMPSGPTRPRSLAVFATPARREDVQGPEPARRSSRCPTASTSSRCCAARRSRRRRSSSRSRRTRPGVREVSPTEPPSTSGRRARRERPASSVGTSLGDRAVRQTGASRAPRDRRSDCASTRGRSTQALRPLLAGLDTPLILAAAEPLDGELQFRQHVPASPHGRSRGTRRRRRTPRWSRPPAWCSTASMPPSSRRSRSSTHVARPNGERPRTSPTWRVPRPSARSTRSSSTSTRWFPGSVDETRCGDPARAADDAVNYGVVDEIARRVWLNGGRVLAVRRDDIPRDGRSPRSCATRSDLVPAQHTAHGCPARSGSAPSRHPTMTARTRRRHFVEGRRSGPLALERS